MANSYDKRDVVTITATFTNSSNVATDPTAAIIRVVKPNSVIASYLSSTGWTSNGNWNASTNVPALADGTGTAGHYYTVTVAGTQSFDDRSISFSVGDRIYYNGYVWEKLENVSAT